jgi:UDP-N-acetylglucosamine--N-acetylmuramyl-(pentapeptide) pyrophosphoryl-undecaprenol N-acetylglucosamine transferase
MSKLYTKLNTVVLVGSRTGGPMIPLLALKEQLLEARSDLKFVVFGVRGGFEEQIALDEGLPFYTLPEVKRVGNKNFIESIKLVIKLVYSCLLSTFYLVQTKPILIMSMSNFLSVPTFWSAWLIRKLKVLNIIYFWKFKPIVYPKLVIHQLDPENTTIKLTARFADLVTVGFTDMVGRLGGKDKQVPNPVRFSVFDKLDKNLAVQKLVSNGILDSSEVTKNSPIAEKPLILIFGGGSGASFINDWVLDNIEKLVVGFRVLHLTGFLQPKESAKIEIEGYYSQKGLTDLMPAALVATDYVVARAGMSTISELLYLRKKAFLIPIPDNHQEKNADIVSRYFRVWTQDKVDSWFDDLKLLAKNDQDFFSEIKWDYYTSENTYIYRDLILNLIPEKD